MDGKNDGKPTIKDEFQKSHNAERNESSENKIVTKDMLEGLEKQRSKTIPKPTIPPPKGMVDNNEEQKRKDELEKRIAYVKDRMNNASKKLNKGFNSKK